MTMPSDPETRFQTIEPDDVEPAILTEVRRAHQPVTKTMSIHQTLVGPGDTVSIPLESPQLVDKIMQDGRPMLAPAGRTLGAGVIARIMFIAPKVGQEGDRATDTTLEFDTLHEDIESRLIGKVACLELYSGAYNPTVALQSNLTDEAFTDSFADGMPQSAEEIAQIVYQQHLLTRRTVVVSNLGDGTNHKQIDLKPMHLPNPEEPDYAEIIALTAETDNTSFRLSDFGDPDLALVGRGQRRVHGSIEIADNSALLRMSGVLFGEELSKSSCALITTMTELDEPGPEEKSVRLQSIRRLFADAITEDHPDLPLTDKSNRSLQQSKKTPRPAQPEAAPASPEAGVGYDTFKPESGSLGDDEDAGSRIAAEQAFTGSYVRPTGANSSSRVSNLKSRLPRFGR